MLLPLKRGREVLPQNGEKEPTSAIGKAEQEKKNLL